MFFNPRCACCGEILSAESSPLWQVTGDTCESDRIDALCDDCAVASGDQDDIPVAVDVQLLMITDVSGHTVFA